MSEIISKDEKEHFEQILLKLKESFKETEKRIYSTSSNLSQNKQYLCDNVHEIDRAQKASIRQSIVRFSDGPVLFFLWLANVARIRLFGAFYGSTVLLED